MNDTALLGALLTSPSVAFAELRERPRFWLPLVLLVLAGVVLSLWYFSIVDIPWLADRMLNANPRLANMPPDARDRFASAMTKNGMLVGSLVGVVLFVPLVYAVEALIYFIAGKVAGIPRPFKQWFTMVCWCSLPALIATVAAAIALSMEHAPLQVGLEQLQVLSLNELFFHRELNQPGSALLNSLSLVTPLVFALMVICVHTWINRSWTFSTVFALLPQVIIYGCWALFAFR